MAEIKFEKKKDETQETLGTQTIAEDRAQTSSGIEAGETVTELNVNDRGLSKEEINDPNNITVTIADEQTPLVILFGPPSCGKTMTLVRLTRFLKREGYTIAPIKSFRPSFDENHSTMCREFDKMINNDDAAESTAKINFMLLMVSYKGRPLCQILEGPGEYYFNPKNPNQDFPAYINTILGRNNRRIWAFMLEPHHTNNKMDWTARRNYVSKIVKLKQDISIKDKIMFIFNKIDETQCVISREQINYKLAIHEAANLYPDIFKPFMNENPITKWWNPYRFDFVAFQTGKYSTAADGTKTFQEANDIYPRQLWQKILKRIRG